MSDVNNQILTICIVKNDSLNKGSIVWYTLVYCHYKNLCFWGDFCKYLGGTRDDQLATVNLGQIDLSTLAYRLISFMRY